MSDDAGRQSRPADSAAPQTPQVDVKLLAEKVYRLMLADVRLAQARGVAPQHKKKR